MKYQKRFMVWFQLNVNKVVNWILKCSLPNASKTTKKKSWKLATGDKHQIYKLLIYASFVTF